VTPIVELLRARAARASRAPHSDGAKIALCVEGGAMRGVVSAGMVSALEELGLGEAFDAVYGSSAGAINTAYFLAGQAAFGTAIYADSCG
jgi:predicted acylesterase/phospholipase RssA